MNFEVASYEHPDIFVRNKTTGEQHRFCVNEDETLAGERARFDLGDARRAAIVYLFKRRREQEVN